MPKANDLLPGVSLGENGLTAEQQRRADAAELHDDNQSMDEVKPSDDFDDEDDISLDTDEEKASKKTSLSDRTDFMEEMASRRRAKIEADAATPNVDDDAPDTVNSTDDDEGSSQDSGESQVDSATTDVAAQETRPATQSNQPHNQVPPPVQAPIVQQQPATQQPQPDAVDAELAQLRNQKRDAMRAMYNGDESAIDTISELDLKIEQKILERSSKVDVIGQITQHARQQNLANWQANINSDEQILLQDPAYEMVTKNPQAYGMVVAEAGRLMKESDAAGRGVRPLDVMKQAADNVLAVARLYQPAAPARDIRQERKQQMGNTAVTAGAARNTQHRRATTDERPDGGATPQQARVNALQELRKSKGEKD